LTNLEKYDEAETHIYNCPESGAGMGSPILAALIKKKKQKKTPMGVLSIRHLLLSVLESGKSKIKIAAGY